MAMTVKLALSLTAFPSSITAAAVFLRHLARTVTAQTAKVRNSQLEESGAEYTDYVQFKGRRCFHIHLNSLGSCVALLNTGRTKLRTTV